MRSSDLIHFIIILFLCSSCDKHASPRKALIWDKSMSTEQNIAINAISLKSDNEFPFLDDLTGNTQVIILGEQGHNDPATTKAKINMIQHLQESGFNRIAFEIAPFLSTYVFSNHEYREYTKNWEVQNLIRFSPWTNQKEFEPMFDKINKRLVQIWGMDSHLGEYDISCAKEILKRHSDINLISIDWIRLHHLYRRHFVEYNFPNNIALTPREQFELMRMIDDIANYTQFIISSRERKTDLAAIMQWVRNVNMGFSYVKHNSDSISDLIALSFRNRDIQMAENIIWFTENFPKTKFLIWCANFHGAKDISQTQYPTDSLLYFTYQSMGEHLYDKLGNNLYSIATTSLNYKQNTDKGMLEMEIAKATKDAPYAFLDFRSLRFEEGYRDKEFDCNIIMKKTGKWLNIFDGIYYIKDQD